MVSSETGAVLAFIGLGSNLGGPVAQIASALGKLQTLPDTRLHDVSSCYRTAPMGLLDQPDFINCVASVMTSLGPRALLEALLAIERSQARRRSVPNAPRTLDLDLLTYGDLRVDEPGLTVPHPRLEQRGFVVIPLAEIAPGFVLPSGAVAAELAARLAREQRVEKLVADAVA